MMRALDKRGLFYLFTVMLFLVVLIAFFYGSSTLSTDRISSQQTRARSVDDFISDFHRDLDRAAFISGFRALIALEQQVIQTGSYLDNTSGDFAEVFYNGTLDGLPFDILENASFMIYLSRVNYEAKRIGITLNLSLENVTLYHISPWDVAVDFWMQINISDDRSDTRWGYTHLFSTVIPIFDLRDPLYSVETNGKAPNTIRRLENLTEFVDDAGDKNDTTVLAMFLDDSYYVASTSAPSFLMRFVNNLSASEFGIESLVDLDELDAQGIWTDPDRSVVDYLFFGTPNSADWCDVQNMPGFFRLDAAHLGFYEVDTELEYGACP